MKRAIDVVFASAALVMLAPVLVGIALAVRLTEGCPVLFRQQRPGLHGEIFTIIKFRTMRVPWPDEVWYRTDAQRVTRLGRFLRATSLDELPELWNVVRGEMSLVGPRPLLEEYLESYTPRQARRHDVRPGITSWAIVNGRHALSFAERLEMDVWYVEHWSSRLDAKILLKTVSQMLRRKSVAVTQNVDEIGFPLPALRYGSRPPSSLPGPSGRSSESPSDNR
jgi:lipopolysaccharide/colanic/teichoic acid biosynthesis glycosyltransferase